MDDIVNRLAREMSDALARAAEESEYVEAVRRRARAAGFELLISMEANVGFVSGKAAQGVRKGREMIRTLQSTVHTAEARAYSANDQRFLRSLRIADVAQQEEAGPCGAD